MGWLVGVFWPTDHGPWASPSFLRAVSLGALGSEANHPVPNCPGSWGPQQAAAQHGWACPAQEGYSGDLLPQPSVMCPLSVPQHL